MKKVLKYVFFCLFVAGFCTGMAFLARNVRGTRTSLVCRDMEITFLDTLGFVSEKDVKDYIREEYGACFGAVLDSIRLESIESIVESKSAISNCEAWVTDDGILHIDILQRMPAVHFQKGSHGYYADDRGYIFPLHPEYTADVPLVKGNLPVEVEDGYRGEAPSESGREWIGKVLRLLTYMQENGEWKTNFDGVEVAGNGDIVLLPVSGEERFVLGKPEMIEDKFSRIHKYYTLIKASKGEIYGTVNVKYKGQIVCKTKDMLQPLTSGQEK
ncbi:MAG: hypothetical protein MJY89_03050 [Bacteroidales bacterium]|nr:hypothetical protein [Bacteroidales bacterium]